jgi:hypothetical protein
MKQSFGRIPFRKGYPKCPSHRSKSQPVGVIRTTSTTRRTIVAAAFRACVVDRAAHLIVYVSSVHRLLSGDIDSMRTSTS